MLLIPGKCSIFDESMRRENRNSFNKTTACIRLLLFILLLPMPLLLMAQTEDTLPKAKQKTIFEFAPGILVPVADFSDTHLPGISAGFLCSSYELGTRNKRIFPVLLAQFSFLPGKKEQASGYSHRHPEYFQGDLGAGIYVSTSPNTGILLSAGAGGLLYSSVLRFTTRADLSYFIRIKEKYPFMPGISFSKEKKAFALWAAHVRYLFRL